MSKIPELTRDQQEVADQFLLLTVDGKATRRVKNPDGTYSFPSEQRAVHIIDFPQREGEFALKSHETNPEDPLSPYFVNFRNLPPILLGQFGKLLAGLDYRNMPGCCTGIPTAGVDIAKAFSEASGIKYVEVFRKEEYPDGTRKIVAATDLPDGDCKNLLIIDDLITRGKTKFEAVEVAEELGYQPMVAVILDREQGGKEDLQARENPIELYSALPISLILRHFLQTGQISEERYGQIEDYRSRH